MNKAFLAQPELGCTGVHYFPQELRPEISICGENQIIQATRYEQHEELEYILVRKGNGTLIVNGVSRPLCPGSGALFMSFDFHRFVPSSEAPLILDYFRVSVGTYLYALASPYQPPVSFDILGLRLPILRFEKEDLTDILRLFDSIRHPPENSAGIEVFYALEVMEKYSRSAKKALEHKK